MAEIILVTGGTRSGKSDYAQQHGETIAGSRCFIATCSPEDPEMRKRVQRHRQTRDPRLWHTVEEPLELEGVIKNHADYQVYLLDCLTLWVSNLMAREAASGCDCDEATLARRLDGWLNRLAPLETTALIVTGEVGLGIVPDNKVARRYRDLVGDANKIVAARADQVVLVSCGLPLYLKKK